MLIRLGVTADIPRIQNLVGDVGLFEPGDELEGFRAMISEHLAEDSTNAEDNRWAVCFDGAADYPNKCNLIGCAYYAPEKFADGVSNLYFIAFRPDVRGKGFGSALLQFVEKDCKERGIRMLIVETSVKGEFDKTRGFYKKNHYEQEGTIRDYYSFGEGKTIFRKLLIPPPTT